MTEYGAKPHDACKRHSLLSWVDVKETHFGVHQHCRRCGWRRALRYAGTPKVMPVEDLTWLERRAVTREPAPVHNLNDELLLV